MAAIPANGEWRRAYLSNVLNAYDTLAQLCLHEGLHGLRAMQTYLDVDQFVRQLPSAWDWNEFVTVVKSWRIRSAAYHTFYISQFLMNSPVPKHVFAELNPGATAKACVQSLISAESLLAAKPTVGWRYPALVKLALVDRWRDVARLLRRVVLPSRAWRNQRYGNDAKLPQHWQHLWQVVQQGS